MCLDSKLKMNRRLPRPLRKAFAQGEFSELGTWGDLVKAVVAIKDGVGAIEKS